MTQHEPNYTRNSLDIIYVKVHFLRKCFNYIGRVLRKFNNLLANEKTKQANELMVYQR